MEGHEMGGWTQNLSPQFESSDINSEQMFSCLLLGSVLGGNSHKMAATIPTKTWHTKTLSWEPHLPLSYLWGASSHLKTPSSIKTHHMMTATQLESPPSSTVSLKVDPLLPTKSDTSIPQYNKGPQENLQ